MAAIFYSNDSGRMGRERNLYQARERPSRIRKLRIISKSIFSAFLFFAVYLPWLDDRRSLSYK